MPKTEKKGKHSKKDKSTKSPRHEDTSKGGGKHEPDSTCKPDDKQHGGHGHDDSSDKGHKDDKGNGHDESADKDHGHDDSSDKGHGPKR